jgi:hypothetical protein
MALAWALEKSPAREARGKERAGPGDKKSALYKLNSTGAALFPEFRAPSVPCRSPVAAILAAGDAPYISHMVRIAISPSAFAAIASTLPTNVSFENARAPEMATISGGCRVTCWRG